MAMLYAKPSNPAWNVETKSQRKENTMSNAKELNAASIQIAKSATELGKTIHLHCLALMNHVIEHRDVSVCDVFFKAVAKVDKEGRKVSVVRSEAIKKWLQKFAFVSFKADKASELAKPAYKVGQSDNFKTHKAEAKVQPWNKFTVEPGEVKTSFDIDAEIDRMIEALMNRIDDAQKGEGRFGRQTPAAKAGNKFESDRLAKLVALKRVAAAA